MAIGRRVGAGECGHELADDFAEGGFSENGD